MFYSKQGCLINSLCSNLDAIMQLLKSRNTQYFKKNVIAVTIKQIDYSNSEIKKMDSYSVYRISSSYRLFIKFCGYSPEDSGLY